MNISKILLAIQYMKKDRPTSKEFNFMLKYHPEMKKVFKIIEECIEQKRIYERNIYGNRHRFE